MSNVSTDSDIELTSNSPRTPRLTIDDQSTGIFDRTLQLNTQPQQQQYTQNIYALSRNLIGRRFVIPQQQPVQQQPTQVSQQQPQQTVASSSGQQSTQPSRQQQPVTQQFQVPSIVPTQQRQQQQQQLGRMATSVSVRAPEPEKYNGDSAKLNIWLYAIKLYFGAVGWDPASATHGSRCAAFAASLLTGPALQWHHRMSLTQQGAPTTFVTFEQQLRSQFGVLDAERRARDKLKILRQQGSVADYIKKFESIVMYLPQADPAEILHAFTYGLKDQVRYHVLLQNPQTVNDAQTAALTVDDRARPNFNIPRQNTRADNRPDVVPMEIGNMYGRRRNNNKGKKSYGKQNGGNNGGRNNNNNRNNANRKQPSRPCRHCGGNHWDKDCRNKPSSSRPSGNNKQHFNNMPLAVADTSETSGCPHCASCSHNTLNRSGPSH